ncbi:hypothetical protein GCM10023194_76260 [Planotetraspora phitsanulokensis]|uniref:Uncharacterized protein n=1 Tax=Planotetraspora phitsanulokensis TaxID=575192 RepID=A0A8J3TZ81_9ACTN|nr:hypothetical protein [Planotetraspora phitsanulokensis]GII35440.1 hypothetical protein Pph01_04430 [Planotetraspora phitsanulokensis]
MSPGDWFQAVSAVVVVVALVLNVMQLRALGRQNMSLATSLHQTLVQANTSSRAMFFWRDPGLLAWHLSHRGYGSSTRRKNQKRLYIIVEIELHEFNYLNYRAGLLPEHVWAAWKKVLEADFAVPEFREMWSAARPFFAPPFVAYVDTLLSGPLRSERGVAPDTHFFSRVFHRAR